MVKPSVPISGETVVGNSNAFTRVFWQQPVLSSDHVPCNKPYDVSRIMRTGYRSLPSSRVSHGRRITEGPSYGKLS